VLRWRGMTTLRRLYRELHTPLTRLRLQWPDNAGMRFIEPCLPTISRSVPTGPQWAYEIKHDGFRFLAVRHRKQFRIYSRGGHDWSERLPAITAALKSLPVRSAVIDGEGVICGPDGKSDFDAMRACFSRYGAPEAFLYAFDLLEIDGRDMMGQSYSGRRVSWGWRVSSPSGVTAATTRDDAASGSRSRTRRIRLSSGQC
jgi:ATP-dependent DNA ligase